jgi:ABC-2 type transport system permease protein
MPTPTPTHLPVSLSERRSVTEVFPAGPGGEVSPVSALASLRADLALYATLVRAQIHAQLQYRTSFALQSFSQFILTFTDFIMLLVLFHRFPSIAGWTLPEVAFLYGLGGLAFGISDLVCGGFDNLSAMIRLGTFDRVLTRPVGTFAQVLASDVQIRRFGRIAQGGVVLGLAISWLDVAWRLDKVVVAASAVISGVVIFTAIWVIGAAVTFWTVETSEVTNVFTYGGEALVSYPMPIYAEGIRWFFTYIVPLAFVSYLPAIYILERSDPLGLPPILQLCSPIVAAVFLVAARLCWAFGVRHYQGTGS